MNCLNTSPIDTSSARHNDVTKQLNTIRSHLGLRMIEAFKDKVETFDMIRTISLLAAWTRLPLLNDLNVLIVAAVPLISIRVRCIHLNDMPRSLQVTRHT